MIDIKQQKATKHCRDETLGQITTRSPEGFVVDPMGHSRGSSHCHCDLPTASALILGPLGAVGDFSDAIGPEALHPRPDQERRKLHDTLGLGGSRSSMAQNEARV